MNEAAELDVFLRVIDLDYLFEAALDEPVLIITTFRNGRMSLREIVDRHGELQNSTTIEKEQSQ